MKKQPWSSGDATDEIRRIARSDRLRVTYSQHSKDQMAVRDLIVGDVLYVLKNGFVHRQAQTSTQPGLYKYRIESRTPNSNNRGVAVIVIPDPGTVWMKIITVMWDDD